MFRGISYIGMRSVLSKPARSITLIFVLTILIVMPIGISLLVNSYTDSVTLRAENTPLLLVSKGSRFDRLMEILYFSQNQSTTITYKSVAEINSSGLGYAIPIYINHTIKNNPLVAVSSDYYEMRGLVLEKGTLPLRLGDIVVGSSIAKELNLSIGEHIITDSKNQFDIAGSYPVNMRVVGILAKSGDIDDKAFFCGIKSGWLVDGLSHGHQKIDNSSDKKLQLKQEGDNIVGSSAIKPFVEVTDENFASFHFHGEMNEFPISSLFIITDSFRSRMVLMSRLIEENPELEILTPKEVANDLVALIFDLKKIVDIVLAVSIIAAIFLLFLVIHLSLQLRDTEFSSLYKLGASKKSIFLIASWDLFFYLTMALLFALIITIVIYLGSSLILGGL